MKIKEVQDKVTDYDENVPVDPNSPAEAVQNERKINIFNADSNDFDLKSLTNTKSKVPSFREKEQQSDMSMTKPIRDELITYGAELFNKLKDKLLDITDPDQSDDPQPDGIMLQSSKSNSKSTLQSSNFENAEPKRIEDIYNDIFRNASQLKETIATFVDDARALVGDVSASASPLQPKTKEKKKQKSFATSTADVHKFSKGKNDAKEKQDSIINTVISISITTIDMDREAQKIMGRVESTNTSNESMFFIKKNSDDDSETDLEMYTDAKRTETKQSIYNQLKLLQLEEDIKAVNILEKKLAKLQTAVPQSHSNRFFEKGVRQDLEEVAERDNRSAGDTFEILSNSTDYKLSEDDTETDVVVKTKGRDVTQQKRLSFATNRKSKAFKRKDLLSNISKAQAALQKTKLTLNDSECPENDTRNESKKSGQKSIEVLKTLQFDDESFSEGSLNQCSPLKRTAFGETSYMRETKGNAIPIHYKNVSKENKELMVKSVMADKSVAMNPSMQSTKIQTNLFTYSQGVLDSELYSNSGSNLDLDKLTSVTSTVASYKSKSGSLRNLVTFSGNTSEHAYFDLKSGCLDKPVEKPAEVLVFDHLNPLNNILLRPINYMEAHKYNPMKVEEKLCHPKQHRCIDKDCNQVSKNDTRLRSRDFEVRTVTIKQHRFTPKTTQKAGQRIRLSTPYSVGPKQPRAETENMTKLSEDLLQNRFSLKPNAFITKTKKRICSLSTDKHRYHRSVAVTPKPKTKMQKISNSPKVKFKVPKELCLAHESLHCLSQEKHVMQSTKRNTHSSKTRAKKWPKSKATKPGQSIFVQQLIADYIGFYTGYENNNEYDNKSQNNINLNLHPKTESFTALSQSGLSFSSSKNLNPIKDVLSTSNQSIRQGMPSQVSWQAEPPPPKVLVFDYLNSMNNVLLAPLDATEAHKYNPMNTEETICGSKRNPSIGVHIHNNQESKDNITKDFEMQTMTMKQHLNVPRDQRNRFSKPHLVNKEEQAAEINRIATFSEITLQDHDRSHSHTKITVGKKRIHSRSSDNHRHLSLIEVTPKPVTKTQNISSSSKVKIKVPVEPPLHRYESAHSIMPEKDDTKNTDRKAHTSKTRGKRPSKSKGTKLGQTKTTEPFINDYTGDTNFKHNGHEKNLLDDGKSDVNLKSESLSVISQSGVTFTLSKNLNPTKDVHTASNTQFRSPRQSTMQDTADWPPEPMCTTSSIKYDSDSGVNVVAKIDMLPFMGSQECEWETSPADTWSFRLLNGRLRLTARLAHRLHNATRTRVRGDTPLLDITVAAVQYDRVDLVARMCARFACETLRTMVSHATRRNCYASDIPPLLRRCAAVVRVALRWKRAMYDAKVRLAYTLDSCGNLSLKVANIPLRSVWEVTMRIGLVSDDASSVPCPRASYVRVQPVVSDVLVPAADVRRALLHTPKDWGHVPSTIWRVYKLLKHKKRDDELFFT